MFTLCKVGFPSVTGIKNPDANAGDASDMGLIPGLEQEMATHSSILAWKIQWTEEPGKLQSMRPKRAGHS